MKIALVVPDKTKKYNEACAPLNLAYLASYIRKFHPEIEIKIFDGSFEDTCLGVQLFGANIVGVTATTPQAPTAYVLCSNLRNQKYLGDDLQSHTYYEKHNRLIVMGGIHATCMPQEALQHADCVVTGEGEKAFLKIVEDYLAGKKTFGIVTGEPVEELDTIPSPAFDLIDNKYYLERGASFPGLVAPVVAMVTSRGCPGGKCTFCWNSVRSAKVRYFSAERIATEILFFREKYGINSVFFNDDEFLINKKRLVEIVRVFKEKGISSWIKWGCQAKVQTISDRETLRLAKSAGCVVISTGFESRNQRILSYLKGGSTTLLQQEKAVQSAKECGVILGGSFIFGTPTETLEEMKRVFRWFEQNDSITFFGLNTLIPYPGTPVWNYAKRIKSLPDQVDYERLVPTNYPEQTYIINLAVNPKIYSRFVKDLAYCSWLYSKSRSHKGFKPFFGLAKNKTFWYVLLVHPGRFLHMVKTVAVQRVVY